MMAISSILVAVDGSRSSRRALAEALDLAVQTGARLTSLAVEENLPAFAATVGEMDEELEAKKAYFTKLHAEVSALAATRGVNLSSETRRGHAAAVIVQTASDLQVDLIVLGHTGHSGVFGLLLGSTADKVIDHAPCSVLVVRERR